MLYRCLCNLSRPHVIRKMSFVCSFCRVASQKAIIGRQSAALLSSRIASTCEIKSEQQHRNVHSGHRKHLPLEAKKTKRLISTTSVQRNVSEENAQKFQRPIVHSTIDEDEIKHFSGLAELWWDEAGEFEALHSMNEIRVPLIRDALVSQRQQLNPNDKIRPSLPLDGLQIVDVGSGGGILSEPLARLGAFVVGVDASVENIKIAQAHVMHDPRIASKIKYIQATVEDLVGTEAGKFDAVVASEVVEHVADVSTFVRACCQLVKPGGSVFFTTLNKTYLSYVIGVVAAENLLGLVAPGTHDWNKFIPPQDLQYIIDQNDFSTRLLHGMFYNPLTKRWSWMKDTSISYAIHAVKAVDAKAHTSA